MSWKSLVITGVLCVLATPVWAVPDVFVTSANLATSGPNTGMFVWNVQIRNTNPIPTGTSALAAELGFAATGTGLVGASNLSTGAGDDFDTVNPGTSIFGWEATGGAATNGKPEGLQTRCAAGCTSTGAGDQVFAALGSQVYSTTGPHDFIQIVAGRPSTAGSLTSTITLSGAYGGKGRVAEANAGTPPSVNHDVYSGVASRTLKAGDATLDGSVGLADLSALGSNYNGTGKTWLTADFTGDGAVGLADLSVLGSNYNQSGGSTNNLVVPGPPGSGLGAGAGVPEPTTVALLGLALLASLGIIRKR